MVSEKRVSVQAVVGTVERVEGPVDPKELWVQCLQGKMGTPTGAGMCGGATWGAGLPPVTCSATK